MSKRYMAFLWALEGGGFDVYDSCEEAKREWCFGRMVFEINAADEEELIDYGHKVKSNKLMIERVKENYPLVYQDGGEPTWLLK